MERTECEIKEELAGKNENMKVIAWYYDQLKIYETLEEFLEDDIILSRRLHHLRVFNEDEEYYYWRKRSGEFKCRFQNDTESEKEFKDENIKLLGSVAPYTKAMVRHYYADDYSGFVDSRYVQIGIE